MKKIQPLTEDQQRKAINAIHKDGRTVAGWARLHNFSHDTVRNVLNRADNGVGPKAEEIIKALTKDGYV